ncbi:MAG: FAD-dependent oxidoreductase [Candidatus Edwardsbacteria bacterium]|nr:FAD-dependent oxidoreductase [Candidatus Edwardsbacteria bacterium]
MVRSVMKEIGVMDKIEFVRQRSRFVSDEFDIQADSYADFKQGILAAFPDDRESLKRYFKEVDTLVAAIEPFLLPAASWVSYAAAGIKAAGVFLKYGKNNLGDFTAKYFPRNGKLFRLFKNFVYPDMSAMILGGAIASIFSDYWTVKGGMQSWADALSQNFTKLGGGLKLGSPVEKIITGNGRAVGVISRGTRGADDYVISAGDYKKTFLKLLDDRSLIPDKLLKKVETTQVSEGIVTVYLGLRLSNDQLRRGMKIPHVSLFDEQPGADVRNPDDAAFFEKSSVMLYSPSLHDPALAPEGKSSLMLQTVSPLRWMDNWGGGDREKYRQLKQAASNAMVRKAAKLIPGLEGQIEFRDAATPLTYERYTGNTDGATSSWSWNPKNKFHKSITGTFVDTPVRNLYIGSGWAMQIGGIPGAISAAQRCVKRIG